MKIYFPSCFALTKKLPIDLKLFIPLNEGYRIAFNHNVDKFRFSEYSSAIEKAEFIKYGECLFDVFCRVVHKMFSSCRVTVGFYDKISTRQCLNYLANPLISILTDDQRLIENIFWDSLMYKSFPLFIDSYSKSVIVPTDHLDLFIASKSNLNLSEIINTQKMTTMEWKKW